MMKKSILRILPLLALSFSAMAACTLAATPQESITAMDAAFSNGDIDGGRKIGLEILKSNDTDVIRSLAEYVICLDSAYVEDLREPVMKKAQQLGIDVSEISPEEPTEGAPWRLHAVPLDSSYEDLSDANDTAGITALGLELYNQGAATTKRYGIGLLHVAASMQDAEACKQLATMYRQGEDVPKDTAGADFLQAYAEEPSIESSSPLREVFSYCLGNGGTPDIIRERGVDFAEGRNGVKINEKTAICLYRVAADLGDATAARWLGWRYLQGRGVKKDRELARTYFIIAALQGDPRAKDALKHQYGLTVESSR